MPALQAEDPEFKPIAADIADLTACTREFPFLERLPLKLVLCKHGRCHIASLTFNLYPSLTWPGIAWFGAGSGTGKL